MSGLAVEAAGDVQKLLLGKTGTITLGERVVSAFHLVDGHGRRYLAGVQLESLSGRVHGGDFGELAMRAAVLRPVSAGRVPARSHRSATPRHPSGLVA
jgi:hypothetical protein